LFEGASTTSASDKQEKGLTVDGMSGAIVKNVFRYLKQIGVRVCVENLAVGKGGCREKISQEIIALCVKHSACAGTNVSSHICECKLFLLVSSARRAGGIKESGITKTSRQAKIISRLLIVATMLILLPTTIAEAAVARSRRLDATISNNPRIFMEAPNVVLHRSAMTFSITDAPANARAVRHNCMAAHILCMVLFAPEHI